LLEKNLQRKLKHEFFENVVVYEIFATNTAAPKGPKE